MTLPEKELIEQLRELIKPCDICGTDLNDWKECGCDQEGFNKGIEKAIELIEGTKETKAFIDNKGITHIIKK